MNNSTIASPPSASSATMRQCLRIIRDTDTLPSTILPNGRSAKAVAHEYVLFEKYKRSINKKRRKASKAKAAGSKRVKSTKLPEEEEKKKEDEAPVKPRRSARRKNKK